MKKKAINFGMIIFILVLCFIYYLCTKHYYQFDISNNIKVSCEKDSYTFDEANDENYSIPIVIENTGYKTVSSTGFGLNISYHLLDEDGNLYKNSDFAFIDATRSPVGSISPYSSKTYDLNIHFPEEISDFTHGYLQIDIVDEGRFWFSNKGIEFPTIELTINR